MPTKSWVVGEEVLAADFNSYVQRQVVATFANAAARDAAIGAPTQGMVCYLLDTNRLQTYTYGAWQPTSQTSPILARLVVPGNPAIGSGLATVASAPFTLPGARVVRIVWAIEGQVTLGSGYVLGEAKVDGAKVGSVLQASNITTPQTWAGTFEWMGSLAAGAHSASMDAQAPGATFTVTGAYSYIFVYDAGPV